MKKLFLVMLLIVVVTGMALAGCAKPAPAPVKPIELTLAHHFTPITYMHAEVYEPWAKELEKRTEGRVKVTIHPNQTLAKSREVYDVLLKGGVDMGTIVSSYYVSRIPLTDAFNLPFLLPSFAKDKTGKLLRNIIFEEFIAKHHFTDVKVIFAARYPPIVLHMVDTPVRTMEDIEGKLIGVPGGKTLPALVIAVGGSPEVVRTNDVYPALEKGMTDGHLLPLETQVTRKFYEVTKYVTLINTGSALNVLVMRQETWDSLPPDIQGIIDELGPWAEELSDKATIAATEEAAQIVQEKGVELITLAPEERQRWIEATKVAETDWAERMDAEGLPGTEMLNRVYQLTSK